MQTGVELSLQDIEQQVARAERRNRLITVAIAAAVVGGAALFLQFTYHKLESLNGQLQNVTGQLEKANTDLNASQQRLESVNTARSDAEDQLKKLQAEAANQAGQIAQLSAQLAGQRQQAESLKQDLQNANSKLDELKGQIKSATDFTRYGHQIDFADAKNLYNTSSPLGELLSKILELQRRNLVFDFANRIEAGFTSPGFAGYVLQQLGKLPAGMAPDRALQRLPAANEPQLGDIIQYETGFALFYLKDRRGAPFVIGMTPLGIASLNLDFKARRTGVLRTNIYPDQH